MRAVRGLLLAAAILALPALATAARAQDVDRDAPALITADDLSFDEELGTATARGNVEIVQGDRILRADAVAYNRREDIVTATGNVVLLEPTGEVLFAEFAELTADLREGFLRGFRMLLDDDSRLAAVSAQRRGGTETELTRAAYSPCLNCKDLDDGPLWQVKARRVTHDSEADEIVYRDATLEFLGVPVAYAPFFSHPDPSVKRKTGFLSPTFGVSDVLGTNVQLSHFWVIDRERDFTFEPIIAANQLPVLQGEYRQRFADGEVQVQASTTNDDAQTGKSRFRGHLGTRARFSVDDFWRWGADLKLASDDTYLQRYGLSNEDMLTNHLFVEGFGERSYAVAQGYYFQGLRAEDIQERIPLIVPDLSYSHVGTPGPLGGMTTLDANFRALSRETGASHQRINVTPGWQVSHTNALGMITGLRVSAQTDLYNVTDVPTDSGPEDGVFGRVFPQAIAGWRYPWVHRTGADSQVIEPLAAFVLAPNGGNPEGIPNEDSQSIAFDETNLFDANRFPGTDRVEGGQRVVYGMRIGLFDKKGSGSTLVVGQSYRFRDSSPFPSDTGLENQLSDIVASVQIKPRNYLDLLYKTRFDHSSLRARRTEVSTGLGPQELRLNLDYVFFDKTNEFADREEVVAGLTSRLSERWSAGVLTRRSLTPGGGTLSYGGSLGYVCDCMTFELDYTRTFTRDRDVPPVQSLMFRIVLKNLGQFGSTVF